MTMLDYTTHGDPARPSLLLLHAGALTRNEWKPFLETWSRRFHVVTPTALGHGASPAVDRLTFAQMVDTVLALLDHLGIERAHFVGSSMGGVTSLRLALAHPGRVDRLVLYRSGPDTGPRLRESLRGMQDLRTWARWGLADWIVEQHREQGGEQGWQIVTQRVLDLLDPSPAEPEITDQALASITAPTLIVCGDRDPLVPLADLLRLRQHIRRSALWIVPNADHVIGAESTRKAAFEQEITRFLTHEPPTPR